MRAAAVMQDSEQHQPNHSIYSWETIENRITQIRMNYVVQFYLFRHAETVYNKQNLITGQSDTRLTEKGRAAARALSNEIPKDFALVFCSGLSRARETMSLALQSHSNVTSRTIVDDRFNEVSLGLLEGTTRVRLEQFATGDIDFAPSGGESYRTAAQRIFSGFIDAVVAAHFYNKGRAALPCLLFSHAGTMRILKTLIDEQVTAQKMFDFNFSTQSKIVISADAVYLPEFWRT